jgi:hypothetical protein
MIGVEQKVEGIHIRRFWHCHTSELFKRETMYTVIGLEMKSYLSSKV